MRQTCKRTTVYKDETTKVVVEVRREIPTPLLDELHHYWWVKNCEEDQTNRELDFILGPNWRNKR
jgi:hypothetical protein